MTTAVVPYSGQGNRYGDDDIRAVVDLLRSDAHLSSGAEVAAFEREFADYTGASHAVAVTSCTMALELATRIIGLQSGDEVIVTPLTFQATATALLNLPVRVRFSDVEPVSLGMDPASAAALVNDRTRAIYVTHYGGLVAEMEPLLKLAAQRRIVVVEDCAHALGSTYQGRSAGTLGDIGCWSFHSLKNISTLGQGGMLTVRSGDWAERLRRLRSMDPDAEFVPQHRPVAFGEYGAPSVPRPVTHEKNAYSHRCVAIRAGALNSTMSEPAAAVGRTQLRKLDDFVGRRRALAATLDAGLAELPGITVLPEPGDRHHSYHLYTFLLDDPSVDRDELVRALTRRGIEIVLRYFPLHLLPEWRFRGSDLGDAPVTEEIWFRRLVNLPLYPQLREEQVAVMIDAVRASLDELCADSRRP